MLKTVSALLFGALTLALAGPAGAQTYPSRNIMMVVPYPPGTNADVMARFIGDKLTKKFGKPVVVEAKPGGATVPGTMSVLQAPADGHTLVMVATTYAQVPALQKLPYDPVKALSPVAQVATGPNIICSHPNFAAKTVKELVVLAKAKPGELRYASTGTGGFNHFAGELFNQLAKVKLTHIPYKGGAPAMLDVMTGQVELVFGSLIQVSPSGVRGGSRSPTTSSAGRVFPPVRTPRLTPRR